MDYLRYAPYNSINCSTAWKNMNWDFTSGKSKFQIPELIILILSQINSQDCNSIVQIRYTTDNIFNDNNSQTYLCSFLTGTQDYPYIWSFLLVWSGSIRDCRNKRQNEHAVKHVKQNSSILSIGLATRTLIESCLTVSLNPAEQIVPSLPPWSSRYIPEVWYRHHSVL